MTAASVRVVLWCLESGKNAYQKNVDGFTLNGCNLVQPFTQIGEEAAEKDFK